MERRRIEQAIQRIEAALGRIQAAADQFAPNPTGDGSLEIQHKALRDEVAKTLRDLDRLIEGLEP